MICCAIAAFLITQWIVWFRAIGRTLAGWRVPQMLLVAGGLVIGAQTAAFVWDLMQAGHEQTHQVLAASPMCGSEYPIPNSQFPITDPRFAASQREYPYLESGIY